MAKVTQRKAAGGARVTVVKQQPPQIRVSVPRSAPVKRRSSGRRRSSGGVGAPTTFVAAAIGGAAIGFIEKSSFAASLPQIPFLGRKGTIALGAYFWWKNNRSNTIARDIAFAGAVLSGYELGKEGRISGDYDE